MNQIRIMMCILYLAITNHLYADLVELLTLEPTFVLNIKYATKDNFTHQAVYTSGPCFLEQEAAIALKKVQEELKSQGLGLKIWDGYRPLSAQYTLWSICSDPDYVADPKKGSRHNRGCAVDVTLVSLADGKELEMPTEFDNFTPKAHRDYMDLPAQAIKNRGLLERVMHKHGFIGLPTEWWHFDYQGWEKYPILDIDIDKL